MDAFVGRADDLLSSMVAHLIFRMLYRRHRRTKHQGGAATDNV
jgi:hypothetical protein